MAISHYSRGSFRSPNARVQARWGFAEKRSTNQNPPKTRKRVKNHSAPPSHKSRRGLLNPYRSVNPCMQVSKSHGLAVAATATPQKKGGILSDGSLLYRIECPQMQIGIVPHDTKWSLADSDFRLPASIACITVTREYGLVFTVPL